MDDEVYKTRLDVTPLPCRCGALTTFRAQTKDGLVPCCPTECLGRLLGVVA